VKRTYEHLLATATIDEHRAALRLLPRFSPFYPAGVHCGHRESAHAAKARDAENRIAFGRCLVPKLA
jgi:hypothetical protein